MGCRNTFAGIDIEQAQESAVRSDRSEQSKRTKSSPTGPAEHDDGGSLDSKFNQYMSLTFTFAVVVLLST